MEVRQEAGSDEVDDINGGLDEGVEYDKEVRLSALLEKKRLGWKDIRPLGKLYAIVAYMRASELLYNEFLAAAGRIIPMDNDTRWDSWYTINTVAYELEGHVDTFVKNHRKAIRKYALTPDDWETLREINVFLKLFKKVTKGT